MKTSSVLIVAILLFGAICAGQPSRAQDGSPYGSTVMGYGQKLPNDGRPFEKTGFPEIRDWSTLKITLERTQCYGDCPAYSVEIDTDGTVHYDGLSYVAIPGHHTAKIPQAAIRALYDAFQKADFFWLFDDYAANITDNPSYTISISFDGDAKIIHDYVGLTVGMPKEVTDLEHMIDETADVKKWVSGDDTTFASLRDEGWDFHANDDEHLRIIEGAAESGSTKLLGDLLNAGVPANSQHGCNALGDAANKGNADKVRILLSAGAPPQKRDSLSREGYDCDALDEAASRNNPDIVALMLGVHPDVNFRDYGGRTALMGSAASSNYSDDGAVETTRLLIEAGADVNAKDDNGVTALMWANSDAGVARLLLQSGAKVNDASKSGRTALMESHTPEIATMLLEAGADPWAKDDKGKTALDVAQGRPTRNTASVLKQWMQAHPAQK
jgi:ankyrin repeat protein